MSAAAAAGVGQMSGLSSEKQSAAAAAMQFPLTQRRKRRVLFTQAQVCKTQKSSIFIFLRSRLIQIEDYYLFPVCPQ